MRESSWRYNIRAHSSNADGEDGTLIATGTTVQRVNVSISADAIAVCETKWTSTCTICADLTKRAHIATGTTVQRVNIRVSADAIAVG